VRCDVGGRGFFPPGWWESGVIWLICAVRFFGSEVESSRLDSVEGWLVEQPSSTTSTCQTMSRHNGTYYHIIHLLSLSRLGRLCAAQDAMLRRRCQYQSSYTLRPTQTPIMVHPETQSNSVQRRRGTWSSFCPERRQPAYRWFAHCERLRSTG
jgi:hypothetical protein